MRLNKLKFIFATACLCYSMTSAATNSNISENSETAAKKYNYIFTYDKNMSARSSADLAMSAIEGYRQLDDTILGDTDNIVIKLLSYGTRFVSTSFIMVANHEIGGHGSRLRESNVKVTKYKVKPFSGVTKFKARDFNALKIHQQIAVDTGGMQASYVLSENIKDRYFASNKINPTYGIAYFWTKMDQPSYIFSTKFNGNDSNGNDVNAYVKGINSIYGTNYLTKNKLRSYAYLDLIDPFLFYSAYSFLTNTELQEIPMINLGSSVRYLPATRAILAPYGLERGLVNHFVINGKYVQVNFNYGKNKQFKSYTVGVKTGKLIELGKVSLGGEFAFWSQPKMLTNTPLQEKVKKGGFGAINAEFEVNKTFNIVASAGYKTAGFIEGAPLKASAIIRAGLKLNF